MYKMKLKGNRSPKYTAWPKCEVCSKTAYPQNSLIVEQKTYHHGCFKCVKCEIVLSPNECSMYAGKIYCTTHFNQLIRDSGGSLPPSSKSPSSPKSKGKGIRIKRRKSVRCRGCNKGAYMVESVSVEGGTYHKKCFRCRLCNTKLNAGNYGTHDCDIFCKTHLKEISMSPPITPSRMSKIKASRNAHPRVAEINLSRSNEQYSPSQRSYKSPQGSPSFGSSLNSAPISPLRSGRRSISPNGSPVKRSKSATRSKHSPRSFFSGFSDEEKDFSDSSIDSLRSAPIASKRRRSSGFLRRKNKKSIQRSRSSSCIGVGLGHSAPIMFYAGTSASSGRSSGAESLQQEIEMERRLHEINETNLRNECEKLNEQIQEQNLKLQLYEQKVDDLSKRADQQQRQLRQRNTLNLLFDKQISEGNNQQKIIKEQAQEIDKLKKRMNALEEFTDIQNPDTLVQQIVEIRKLLEKEKERGDAERTQKNEALFEIDSLNSCLRSIQSDNQSLTDQIAAMSKHSELLHTKTQALSDPELDDLDGQLSNEISQYEKIRNQLETKRHKVQQEKSERTNCVVCKEIAGRTIFLPCLHQRTCHKCAENLDKCPLCRTVIESKHDPFH